MYFPGSKPHTAVNRLMRWIGRCGQLRSALEAAHYYPRHAAHSAELLLQLLHILAGKLLHHALHGVKLLEQSVYLNNARAAACGNALFTAGVEYRRVVPLGLRHRKDDGLDVAQSLFIYLCALECPRAQRRHRYGYGG